MVRCSVVLRGVIGRPALGRAPGGVLMPRLVYPPDTLAGGGGDMVGGGNSRLGDILGHIRCRRRGRSRRGVLGRRRGERDLIGGLWPGRLPPRVEPRRASTLRPSSAARRRPGVRPAEDTRGMSAMAGYRGGEKKEQKSRAWPLAWC